MSKFAENLASFRHAIQDHDRRNPTHKAWGIGLNAFDMERLDYDEGEELWKGITIHTDSGCTSNFRVLCDRDHTKSEVQYETADNPLVTA
jgi:hypothetical protein